MEENKRLTRSSFGAGDFKREFDEMQNFRRNCYGEAMDALWSELQDMYVPNSDPKNIRTTYTLPEGGGDAIPDRLFLEQDDEELFHFKEPLVGIKVHTALSLLTQRTPDVKWDSDSYMYERLVPVLDALRKSDWYDTQTRQQYVMMWFYFIMFGTTFWRRFYAKIEREVAVPTDIDPLTGKIIYQDERVTELDQTVGEALSPLDVLIDPNTQPMKPRSMKKVIYTRYFSLDDFRAEFQGKVSDKILNSVKAEWNAEQMQGNTSIGKGKTPQQPKVRVDYYESEYLDLYYVIANQKTRLIKSPLPYRHKKLSIMMAIWMPRNAKSPYGIGPVEMMREDKEALDEFKSMTLTQAKFSIYKAMFYQGTLDLEGQDGADIRIRPDRAYKVSNPKDITFSQTPGPGQDSWRAIQELRARVDDASGINKPLGGEVTKSTAYEIDLAKDAALSRLSVPIDNIVAILIQDAERTLELQKQYYGLPQIKEIVSPDDILKAQENIEFFEKNNIPIPFTIWAEQLEGEEEPRVFVSRKRTAQLGLAVDTDGNFTPSEGKNQIIINSDVFAWKGKIHIVKDSLLSITPTLERTKELELFNLLAPMLGQPPEVIGKIAKRLLVLFGKDYRDYLPEHFLQYFEQLNSGMVSREEAAGEAEMALEQIQNPQEPGQPLTFEQQRAPTAVTNIGGQNSSAASTSQAINRAMR